MRPTLCAVGAFLFVTAGCTKQGAPPQAGPNMVTITAADFAFGMPDTIPAGLTTVRLVNLGPSLHHVQFIRIDSGRTYDSLMAALRNPGPPPAWATFVPGPNPPAPGDSSDLTVTLTAGHYAALCFVPDSAMVPHFVHGMVHPLEVTGSATAAAEPAADIEIHLTDYTFTESVPLTAGRHVIKIVNDGPQPHEMFLARLDSGTTAQGLVDWVAHGMHGRPPARPLGGSSAMAVGAHALFPVTLTPGDYGLYCFWPDIHDGKEHVQHGMLKQIHVS